MTNTRFTLTVQTSEDDYSSSKTTTIQSNDFHDILTQMGYEVVDEALPQTIDLSGVVDQMTNSLKVVTVGDRVLINGIAGTVLGQEGDQCFIRMDDGTMVVSSCGDLALTEMEATPGGEYRRYGYVNPSGRAAVPVRQINGYGDNPWVLGMTEDGEDDNGRETSKTSTRNTIREGAGHLREGGKHLRESGGDLDHLRRLSGLK